jgi:hypothetical protein
LCHQWWKVHKGHDTKPRDWHSLRHPKLRLDKNSINARKPTKPGKE